MRAKIEISLKNGVLDPQAKTIFHALESLGFNCINDLKTKKIIELDLNINNKEEALNKAKEMSEMLLANPVIENYNIELLP
ncbi:phosphoribosylformylglycinamidine synthase subunit PurS [Helicobacter sp. MIT 99-5507]|uniref:phosphoribosylformylglycinamidine synthase subunit PurS n=1 Tax=Helicobacter sp. MIT 99-5507 TaxID=152489 RepID=UPI000E1F635B|nr:phosphoribosylformylglycinamidine synthase subunit PurS [Helicobacter sp. MIT 99-5507]RDU58499.1 phosphoribosylformylglycinamidine synthase [Helicobacter sp. MIT 99-5507]